MRPGSWDLVHTKKISHVMRIFAYGIPADYANEYLHIGKDMTMGSVLRFCKVMKRVRHIFEFQIKNISLD
jgi:hypothetical protein